MFIPDPWFLPIPDPESKNSKNLGQILKNYWSFYPKIVTKLSKTWVWDPGSENRKKPIPDPGFRGQKGTGSRIRIRNNDFVILTNYGTYTNVTKYVENYKENVHTATKYLKISICYFNVPFNKKTQNAVYKGLNTKQLMVNLPASNSGANFAHIIQSETITNCHSHYGFLGHGAFSSWFRCLLFPGTTKIFDAILNSWMEQGGTKPEAESKEKPGVWDPMPELTLTSPYVDSRVDYKLQHM